MQRIIDDAVDYGQRSYVFDNKSYQYLLFDKTKMITIYDAHKEFELDHEYDQKPKTG